MYLMIQNKGVAPVEAFTLLGASGSRDNDEAIGQFGTGTKAAVNVCLRHELTVRTYCGLKRLDFGTVEGEFEGNPVSRVTLEQPGRVPRCLGWVLSWGELDWTDVGMGLREFISNAIDRSGNYAQAIKDGDLVVELVNDQRARDGYTRVYIEASDDVILYFAQLKKRFLHFTSNVLGLLPKAGRSLSGSDKAMIYRKGVFVTELKGESIYDYNFGGHEFKIDDCRNSSEYEVRAAVARRLADATAKELIPVFKSLANNSKTTESELDVMYLCPRWEAPTIRRKAQWQAAWEACFGDAILTDGAMRTNQYVARKGFDPQPIASDAWRDSMSRLGIRAHTDVLTASERAGRVSSPPTSAAVAAVDQVWEWVEAANMSAGKTKPPVRCFMQPGDAESITYAYYEEGTVYLRDDISDKKNKMTLRAALEEVVHHVTGSGDRTRDFQNFAFDLAVSYLG